MKITLEGDMHDLARFLGLMSPEQRKDILAGIVDGYKDAPQKGAVDPMADRADPNPMRGPSKEYAEAPSDAKPKGTRGRKPAAVEPEPAPQTQEAPAATEQPPAEEPPPETTGAPANDIDYATLKAKLAQVMSQKGAASAQAAIVNSTNGKKSLKELDASQYPAVYEAFEKILAA